MQGRVTNFKFMTVQPDHIGSCDNVMFQGYLASLHQISPTVYYTMVMAYFNGAIPEAKHIPINELDLSVNCEQNHIYFNYDEAMRVNNEDTNVQVVIGKEVSGKYSIALFRGIVGLFEPDTFHFSKAINENGEFKLAFYASKNGQPVYYGDLNDLYP